MSLTFPATETETWSAHPADPMDIAYTRVQWTAEAVIRASPYTNNPNGSNTSTTPHATRIDMNIWARNGTSALEMADGPLTHRNASLLVTMDIDGVAGISHMAHSSLVLLKH